jgi:hypothetical protein
MALFLSACLGYRETPLRQSLDGIGRPQYPMPDTGGHIGLGWMLTDDGANPLVWHNGATAGSHAFAGFNPKAGSGVALLANAQLPLETLGFALLGGKPSRPQTAVPNAADYPGLYPLAPAFAIKITAAGGSIFAQATGQPQLALRPLAGTNDRFAIIGVPAEISFERGAGGEIAALVLHQNGLDQRAPRGPLPPPATEETSLPAETLREYAGEYALAPHFALTVTETGGALFVQATGQENLRCLRPPGTNFSTRPSMPGSLSNAMPRAKSPAWFCIRTAGICPRKKLPEYTRTAQGKRPRRACAEAAVDLCRTARCAAKKTGGGGWLKSCQPAARPFRCRATWPLMFTKPFRGAPEKNGCVSKSSKA